MKTVKSEIKNLENQNILVNRHTVPGAKPYGEALVDHSNDRATDGIRMYSKMNQGSKN